MRDSMRSGISTEMTVEVTADMAPGHLPIVVISTPDMIGLIEGACARLAQEHLDEGETTVGTHVCVSHDGVAFEGEAVTVAVTLDKIEGKRLTFAEEVRSPRGPISTGTHERAVIRTDRFSSASGSKP